MTTEEQYMIRCIELAELGSGNVAPNPLVGAILIHHGKIIGEGFHEKYGEAHAEVNCINNVGDADKNLIADSTLFVSLEPCSHFGKTPPCVDLIIQKKIKKVVIGCKDSFTKVNGKGIEKLKAANIEVVAGVMEKECRDQNKRFFTFHEKCRPYVILKWAQTANGKMAGNDERLFISNEFTNRLVHKWRSEEAAILIGTNTALKDDPSLTTKYWKGNNPVRLVLDINLRLPQTLKIFSKEAKTIIFNKIKNEEANNVSFIKINTTNNLVDEMLSACFERNILSILVEGGKQILDSFIISKKYDEIRLIKNASLNIQQGLSAPKNFIQVSKRTKIIRSDSIDFIESSKE